MRGISWIAENRLASQEGVFSMEQVSYVGYLEQKSLINYVHFDTIIQVQASGAS